MTVIIDVILIKMDPEAKYLSDDVQFHAGLPEKCIFDKGKTGCGGTTVALESSSDYVIAVPFVALIKNKVSQHENVCGVYGETSDGEIQEYLASDKVIKKFIVTYDSLERLLKFINPSKYKLLVDEYHILFTHYGSADKPFRKEAVQKVLNNYEKFSDYCFMSASPLENDFVLDELRDLDFLKALWPNTDPIKVNSIHCEDVLAYVSELIQDFLSGDITGNAYFFLNSLTAIEKLIKNNYLKEEDARVIYSESNEKILSLPRSTVTSSPKKINFLTSTVFEGVDIYDENGRVFIVSDQRHSNSLVDISTSFIQIIGRIRNSKHSNEVMHIFSKNRYSSNVTYDEYKDACEKDIMEARKDVELLNKVSESTRNTLMLKKNSGYLKINNDGVFEYDANLVKVDLYQFRLTRVLYNHEGSLGDKYSQYGFDVTHHESIAISSDGGIPVNNVSSFKQKVEFIKSTGYYNRIGYCYTTDDHKKIEQAIIYATEKPELEEAILSPDIGFEGIEKMNYNWNWIKRALIKTRKSSKARSISDMLGECGVKEGDFKSNKQLKEIMRLAYVRLGVDAAPVAEDIVKYFEAEHKQLRLEGGKRVWGWKIISKKRNL
jgi:hypothetical protein